MMKGGIPLFKSMRSTLEVKRILNLPLWEFIALSWSMMSSGEGKNLITQARSANSAIHHLKAIKEGNEKEGFIFADQSVGGINDVPQCHKLIEWIIAEAEKRLEATGENVYV